MLGFLFGVVMFAVVPLTLILFVVLAFMLCGESRGEERQSGIAGLLSGFVGFIIYAIASAAAHSSFPKFTPSHPPKFQPIAFGAGVVIGFALPWILEKMMGDKFLGVSTLILTFAGLAGLYSYLFATSLQGVILYASLSVTLGWLLSGIFYRTHAHKLFLDM